MICDTLKRWLIVHGKSVERTVLIFHTSCLNYDLGELERLDALPFRWVLPDNVYWELICMRDSPHFRERAEFLLSHTRHDPTWDMEQLYDTCDEPVTHKQISYAPLVFLFGDLLKQDEFLRHVRAEENMYILFRTGWDSGADAIQREQVSLLKLSDARGFRVCRPIPTGQRTKIEKTSALTLSTSQGRYGRTVRASEFVPTGMGGTYAKIYADNGDFSGQLVKLYRAAAYGDSHLNKLQSLRSVGQRPPVRELPLAMPLELLYCPQGCAGYVMNRCPGELLRVFVRETERDWEGHDLAEIFRRLFLILLELHTAHILINDLSYNNILIDESDRVSLVDCDSFQIRNYPGGGVTPFYCHREIDLDECYNVLREPRHEYFALAVLLYQCLFLSENPLTQIQDGRDETSLDWRSVRFPLDTGGFYRPEHGAELHVNENIFDTWMSNPEPVRKAFADEFHFRRDVSVGAWIRTLALY